jgi:hypothetical protein
MGKKITYRFAPIPQRLFESIMTYQDLHVQKLGLIVTKLMFCHWITKVELDIYEIKAFGIPEKKVLETIKKIKETGWFEVDIAVDETRALFTKPRITQQYNDHLSSILTELITDAVQRNLKKQSEKEDKHE